MDEFDTSFISYISEWRSTILQWRKLNKWYQYCLKVKIKKLSNNFLGEINKKEWDMDLIKKKIYIWLQCIMPCLTICSWTKIVILTNIREILIKLHIIISKIVLVFSNCYMLKSK